MKNGESVYHCRRTSADTDTIRTYAPAKKYTLRFGYLTVQPATGYSSIVLYGKKITETWIAIANANAFNGVFKEGDLMYVDGAAPAAGHENGKGANAVVDYVSFQNKALRIVLKKAEL